MRICVCACVMNLFQTTQRELSGIQVSDAFPVVPRDDERPLSA
jgi:hypothetical protein